MKVLMILSDPQWNGEDLSVRYLLTDDGYRYFEEDVIYDTYEDAFDDIWQWRIGNDLEFDFDEEEDDYDDYVSEEQEWNDYDPDC